MNVDTSFVKSGSLSLHCVVEPLLYLYTMWTRAGRFFCADSWASVITIIII